MSSKPLFIFFLLLFFKSTYSQSSFSNSWIEVEKELTAWDSVRGSWLAGSLISLAENKMLPKRNFQGDLTPFELIKTLPAERRERIISQIGRNQNINKVDEIKSTFIASLFQKINCSTVIGRSYGDPHISTFDKANYSFQTVGEFIMLSMYGGNIQLQSRQKPQNQNVSLNTAIAINLFGDRIGLYASDGPENGSRLRINGITYDNANNFVLPHGGSIRVNGNDFVFSSPTGEAIVAQIRRTGNMDFINVNFHLFSCEKENVSGLLGNANGDPDDDFSIKSKRPSVSYSALFGNSVFSKIGAQAEKQYLSFLAIQFAEQWRVNNENTLFEYGPKQSTNTFTDRTFPRTHLTLNDLTPQQQSEARNRCEANGVTGEDLRGCIFDQGFINLDPSPRAPVPDFIKGASLNENVLTSGREIVVVPRLNKNQIKKFLKTSPLKKEQFLNKILTPKNILPKTQSSPVQTPNIPILTPKSNNPIQIKPK